MRSFSFVLAVLFSVAAARVNTSGWENFTSGNHISAIVHQGDTIWAATWGGLAKISKKTGEATFYNRANSPLEENAVTALAIDTNHALLTGSSHLQKLDRSGWFTFPALYAGYRSYFYAISIDVKGALRVGDGLFLRTWTGNSWDSIQIGSKMSSKFSIQSIACRRNGEVLVGTTEGLFIVKNEKVVDTVAGEVFSILPDTGEVVWAGMRGSLKKFDGRAWQTVDAGNSVIKNGAIGDMHFDSKRALWLCTEYGLLKFDGKNWTTFTASNSELPENELASLDIDEQDVKWIGTRNKGLVKFDGVSWKTVSTSTCALGDNYATSMAIDREQQVWIGQGTHLYRLGNNQWTTYDTSSGKRFDAAFNRIYEDSVTTVWAGLGIAIALSRDKSMRPASVYNCGKAGKAGYVKSDTGGIYWMLRKKGLGRYRDGKWDVFSTVNTTLPYDDIGLLMIDGKGTVWVVACSTGGDALFSYDGQKWQSEYRCESGMGITAMALDRAGRVWFNLIEYSALGKNSGGGIVVLDGGNRMSYTISNSGLPSNSVADICADDSGGIWIGTYQGGMARFDGKDGWRIMTMDNSGLPENNIMQIEIDTAGNKWIRTEFAGCAVYRDKIGLSPVKPPLFLGDDHGCAAVESITMAGNSLRVRFTEKLATNLLEASLYSLSGKSIVIKPTGGRVSYGNDIFYHIPPLLPRGIYIVRINADGTVVATGMVVNK